MLLYDLHHLYDLQYFARVSWVGSVPLRSCTTYYSMSCRQVEALDGIFIVREVADV